MTPAWIVVRTERHVEDRFWIFEREKDAVFVAEAVVAYWADQYGSALDGCTDTYLREDLVYHVNREDAFRVYVRPVFVRGVGETQEEEESNG